MIYYLAKWNDIVMVLYTISQSRLTKSYDVFVVQYMTSIHVYIQQQNVSVTMLLCLLARKNHLAILKRGLAPLSFHLKKEEKKKQKQKTCLFA